MDLRIILACAYTMMLTYRKDIIISFVSRNWIYSFIRYHKVITCYMDCLNVWMFNTWDTHCIILMQLLIIEGDFHQEEQFRTTGEVAATMPGEDLVGPDPTLEVEVPVGVPIQIAAMALYIRRLLPWDQTTIPISFSSRAKGLSMDRNSFELFFTLSITLATLQLILDTICSIGINNIIISSCCSSNLLCFCNNLTFLTC